MPRSLDYVPSPPYHVADSSRADRRNIRNVYDDCAWIIGGPGNDTIDAPYLVDRGVTLNGGGGNNMLAGGAWSD